MQGNVRLTNAFQVGLLGGLGVLTAILIGGAVTTIANIIAYVFAAIFIALGLDPLVKRVTKLGLHRNVAIPVVAVTIFGFFGLLLWNLVPTLAKEAAHFIDSVPELITGFTQLDWVTTIDQQFDGAISNSLENAGNYFANSKNWPTMLGGVVQVGLTIFNGFFGAIVIVILSVYFMASLERFKRWVYSLVAQSRRSVFEKISEQIAESIGRYVMGQVTIGLLAGIFGLIMMSILGIPYALVLSALVFLFGLIPLVGPIVAAVLVTLVALSVSTTTALVAATYFLVYMQIEAYLISPRVMSKAVEVPGAVVVVAALAGGALLGVMGALIAIPVAASIILIIRQIWVPRQDTV